MPNQLSSDQNHEITTRPTTDILMILMSHYRISINQPVPVQCNVAGAWTTAFGFRNWYSNSRMWTVLFPCFFMAKKIQSNWWILIPLALASGRHCWQVEDSRGSRTCGHHAEWLQCLLCTETLWQWTSHGWDWGIFWEASWMCFFARFLFFLPFMSFHGTTKITKYIQSWRVRFGIWVYYPDIFGFPCFFVSKIQWLVFKPIVILGLADS